jgi:hypothetical protein
MGSSYQGILEADWSLAFDADHVCGENHEDGQLSFCSLVFIRNEKIILGEWIMALVKVSGSRKECSTCQFFAGTREYKSGQVQYDGAAKYRCPVKGRDYLGSASACTQYKKSEMIR